MNTSSRFIIATHILAVLAGCKTYLGKNSGLKSEEIAISVNTNPVFIRRLMGKMKEAGIVVTKPGPRGGYLLNRNASNIKLLEIYNLVEDGSLYHLHYCSPNSHCTVGSHIQESIGAILKESENAFKKVLGKKTLNGVLRDLLNRSEHLKNKSKAEIAESWSDQLEAMRLEASLKKN